MMTEDRAREDREASGESGRAGRGPAPARVDDFLDPDDPTLFPRLTEAQIGQLAVIADHRLLEPGEALFGQGQRETPFFVVQAGAVDIFDQRPEGARYFTQCRTGTFIGDVAVFTGEPTIAAGAAAEPTAVLAITPGELRSLVARSPELGDLILRTMVARRAWLEGHGYGQARLVGSRWSEDAFAVRELLQRNLVPFSWHALESDPETQALLGGLGVGDVECPVLIRHDRVVRRATIEQVASELGLRAHVDGRSFDVVVAGGGPAGLAAAVYTASEGLTTLIVDRFAPGGQAAASARIENYLGFPTALSGAELTQRATLQARKFGVVISSVHEVSKVSAAAPGGLRTLTLTDGQTVHARYLVLASGADYRQLGAANADRFKGSGLYYVATYIEALQVTGEEVVVAGGGNSAGQAAMTLADCARTVHVVVRRPVEQTMSRYLIDRINDAPGIVVWTGYNIGALHGEGRLEGVTIRGDGGDHRLAASAVFAMIGARPRTDWIAGFAGLDDRGFIVTGEDARRHPDFAGHWHGTDRTPLLLESTRRDVFAVGDVRAGSTKRVASAVGDGALVARSIHDSMRLAS
jgi:thioredoxin reductase (NADPH)